MKTTTGLLASLALNAILIAAVWFLWRDRGPAGRPAAPAAAAPAVAGSLPAPWASSPVPPVAGGGDWRTWIEPLRRARLPDNVLADLVRADFDRRWETRQAAMQQRYLRGEADADALAALALEHDAAVDDELRAALGPEAYRAWDMDRIFRSLNASEAGLSAADRQAVYEVERGLRDELRGAQLDRLRGVIDQATQTNREQGAQDAAGQKLRALLGDRRAAALQGADDTEGNLRRSLGTLSLTGTQLRALAGAQQQWDQMRSALTVLETETQNPAYEDLIAAGADQWRDEFGRIAGPAAFDQFRASQDSRYRDLQRFAPSWQLSPAEARQVYDTIANTETAATDYVRDARARGVDPEVMQEVVAASEHQIEESLRESLGARRYGELRDNGVVAIVTLP